MFRASPQASIYLERAVRGKKGKKRLASFSKPAKKAKRRKSFRLSALFAILIPAHMRRKRKRPDWCLLSLNLKGGEGGKKKKKKKGKRREDDTFIVVADLQLPLESYKKKGEKRGN